MARAWILQANPKKWRVFDWWSDQKEPLDDWTISTRLDEIRGGDHFALWISGLNSGVYAIGQITSDAYGPVQIQQSGYWSEPPDHPVHVVDLQATKYLFDRPILKSELESDPDFSQALILRMPGGANPFPLDPAEWQAIRRRAGSTRLPARPGPNQPVVTARPLGAAPEDITVPTSAQQQHRTFREARLVKRYEAWLGSPLMARSIRLPSGELLVSDAVDTGANRLIEAKASASRQDLRMAIGQLLDYRRHLAPRASLAVLLPEKPSDDLLDLLRGVKVTAIVETGSTFTEF